MPLSRLLCPNVRIHHRFTRAFDQFLTSAFVLTPLHRGGILGGIIGPTNVSDDWPTSEMAIRGTLQNFYLGLPIAFFSGMGVAVGLLDSQTNSLVGVAISASLLPPAVNCGMLWVCFWFYERGIFEPEISRSEFYTGGVFSLLLTIANIVLVIVSAMVMFRVKEVSIVSVGEEIDAFPHRILPPEIY